MPFNRCASIRHAFSKARASAGPVEQDARPRPFEPGQPSPGAAGRRSPQRRSLALPVSERLRRACPLHLVEHVHLPNHAARPSLCLDLCSPTARFPSLLSSHHFSTTLFPFYSSHFYSSNTCFPTPHLFCAQRGGAGGRCGGPDVSGPAAHAR